MRTPWLIYGVLCTSLVIAGCGGGNDNGGPKPQCSDGIDNDGDGQIDFPDDLGCISPDDDKESDAPSPQCSDGRDNDGDGKIDFPNDPGCYAAAQDSETDDCPDGPNCPQCSNGKDDDNNGLTDYPDDPGCTFAADNDEFLDNPAACGNNITLHQLPFDGHIMNGMLVTGAPSSLSSPTCGGSGGEDVYELRIMSPKVVSVTTDLPGTTADTVLYIRGTDCANPTAELGCNDDAPMGMKPGASTLNVSITTPGIYFLVVDAHDSGAGGTYEMQVNFLAGEGVACDTTANCGTGLICRVPLGMTDKVCSKHVCSDGVDDDGDGKLDYPTDPGCDTPDDDDESDTCPGAGCPVCSDGIDNDGDGQTDYPNDTNCVSASGAHESCVDTDAVVNLTAATTAGTTAGMHNDTSQSCGSSTATAPDKSYKLHLPVKVDTLTITTVNPSFDAVTAVFGPSCGGTALACEDFDPITLHDLPSGDVYVVVDGYSSGSGTYSLGVTGTIKNNEPCEDALVTAGVLACGPTATCKGAVGAKTCVPAQCSDGLDNNADGKIDYPADPGCDSPTDDTETTVCPGAGCPVCSDGVDNDADGHNDYTNDLSCWAASGTNESFCNGGVETDRAMHVTSFTTLGSTTGLNNDTDAESCQSHAAGADVAVSLTLPVPVSTITIDTTGTSFDTVLSLRNGTCATEIACNDDGSGVQSSITQTNLAAGDYAIIVDGYGGDDGAFVLHVKGKVVNGTACTSPLFASGVLACTGAATCTGGTCH